MSSKNWKTNKNKKTTAWLDNELSLNDFLAMSFRMYDLTGLRLFSMDDKPAMNLRSKVHMACSYGLLSFNLMTLIAFSLYDEFLDTLQLTTYMVYVGFVVNTFTKVASVWLGRHTLRDIVIEMAHTFPRTTAQRREYRLGVHYFKLRRVLILTAGCHLSVTTMFMFFPIVQSTVEYFLQWREDGLFVRRLPYMMYYPFDATQTMWFCFAYTIEMIGGFTLSVIFVGADMMLLTTVYLVNIQFEYLALWIRRKRDPCPIMDELKQVLEFHSRILDAAGRINGVFSLSILLNYTATIFITCLIGFLVVTGSDIFYLGKFFGFLVASVQQIYYTSYYSSNLITLSTDIAVALSDHEWYDADIRYQHMLPLAIARAQKPAYLSAYKFIVLSMETFTNFITTSYQFFTLIKTRYDEKQN